MALPAQPDLLSSVSSRHITDPTEAGTPNACSIEVNELMRISVDKKVCLSRTKIGITVISTLTTHRIHSSL